MRDEELINAVSLVCKKWLLKINNDVTLVRFLSIRKPLNKDIDESEQRYQAENLIQRFNFLRKLMLLDPTILPLRFDKNPELDCVTVNLRNGPTVYVNGNHFLFRLSKEQIMAFLEDPLENHILTNRESILETKVFQLVFNPQKEDVTIENIAPKNIEDFQVIFNFQIRPDMDEWRRELIDNFVTDLEEKTRNMKCLERIMLSVDFELSGFSIDRCHNILTAILGVNFQNFSLNFSLSVLGGFTSDINITMEPLPSNEMITSFRLFDFSDWRLSKRIILRMVEAMPMLTYLNFETTTAHHLLEMLELFSHIDKLQQLSITINHLSWNYGVNSWNERDNSESEGQEMFHLALGFIQANFNLDTEITVKRMWNINTGTSYGHKSYTAITKKKGELPTMNEFINLPFQLE